MQSRRPKPPPSLDTLRAQLDLAAVARVLLPLEEPARRPEDLARILHVALGAVAVPLLVDADGDLLTAIVPADRRIDLYKMGAAVGARQVRLHGAGKARKQQRPEEPRLLSGLPTVLDRSLVRLDHLFSFTGDPQWAIRIGPHDLRRATAAQVADVVRAGHISMPGPVSAHSNEHPEHDVATLSNAETEHAADNEHEG